MELTLDNLNKMIEKAVANTHDIIAIGVVGSFLTERFCSTSDIDLIVKIQEGSHFLNTIDSFHATLEKWMLQIFNRQLDIINYDRAVLLSTARQNSKPYWFDPELYQKMLREVRWVYER